jgi:hypothetical protein
MRSREVEVARKRAEFEDAERDLGWEAVETEVDLLHVRVCQLVLAEKGRKGSDRGRGEGEEEGRRT